MRVYPSRGDYPQAVDARVVDILLEYLPSDDRMRTVMQHQVRTCLGKSQGSVRCNGRHHFNIGFGNYNAHGDGFGRMYLFCSIRAARKQLARPFVADLRIRPEELAAAVYRIRALDPPAIRTNEMRAATLKDWHRILPEGFKRLTAGNRSLLSAVQASRGLPEIEYGPRHSSSPAQSSSSPVKPKGNAYGPEVNSPPFSPSKYGRAGTAADGGSGTDDAESEFGDYETRFLGDDKSNGASSPQTDAFISTHILSDVENARGTPAKRFKSYFEAAANPIDTPAAASTSKKVDTKRNVSVTPLRSSTTTSPASRYESLGVIDLTGSESEDLSPSIHAAAWKDGREGKRKAPSRVKSKKRRARDDSDVEEPVAKFPKVDEWKF